MGFEARIFDGESSPDGAAVKDDPDHFLSVAITHARKSPQRFPLLGSVNLEGQTQFLRDDRERLKSEWVMIESLAIGKTERDKWNVLFHALAKPETFKGVQFIGNN